MPYRFSPLVILLLAAFIPAVFTTASLKNPWVHEGYHRSFAELPGEECSIGDEICWCIPDTSPPDENEPNVDLFGLLTKGSEYLQNYTNENEAVLLLGNTGSGKTTASQIIAGDLSKLHAVAIPGELLVIIDEENRIGLPSIKSKTLFPELVVKTDEDDGRRLSFYDFPGFDDTRGPDQDIAANFFMTEVAKKVTNYKMLFVVIEASVTGQDRIDFNKLVEHATTFVKDITKFSRSFGLLVNKVNNFNHQGYRKDSTIISGIVSFLERYISALNEDLESAEGEKEKKDIFKKIAFVESLLFKGEDKAYPRIWFIRSPNQCGPLSESDIMDDARTNVTKLTKKLEPTRIDHSLDEDPFGFTLKAETLLNIGNYSRQVNTGISSAIGAIMLDLKLWFYQQQQKFRDDKLSLEDISTNLWTFSDSINALINILNENEENISSEDYSQHINDFYEIIGILLPAKFRNFMQWQNTYLNFFDKASGERQERRTMEWKEPILNIQNFFLNYAKWYQFCKTLEDTVSSVEFHKRSYSNKTDSATWLEFIEHNDITPVTPEIKSLLSFVKTYDVHILDKIMVPAMENSTESCDNQSKVLQIKGSYLRTGKYADQLNQLIEACNATEVRFEAGQRVFLDEDLSIPGINLVVISPHWDQRDNPQFLLDVKGKEGPNRTPSRAADGSNGGRGQQGGKGTDADAGTPGGPSGNTFIVADKVIGGTNASIRINSSGGNGGPGQIGGNGGSSGDRSNARCFVPVYGQWDKPQRCEYDTTDDRVVCTHSGFPGYNGGRGGNGGIGGKPGFKGTSDLLLFSSKAKQIFSVTALDGESGTAAQGGEGGTGGSSGGGYRHLTVYCIELWTNDCGAKGQSGTTGGSVKNLEDPAPPLRNISEWQSLLQYRLNFFNSEETDTIDLLNRIDYSTEAETLFTLKPLAEESLSLEKITRSDANQIRLGDMYTSLVDKLERYFSKNFQSLDDQHKKILSILLTSAVASRRNLRSSASGTDIVVDVSGYFDSVLRKINELKEISHRDQVNQTIQLEKDRFAFELDEKIYTARAYIFDEVNPALFSAQEEMQGKADILENQLIDLIEDAELSLEDARKKLKEAEKQQRISRALKGLGWLSKLASKVFPPVDFLDKMVGKLQDKYKGIDELVKRLNELVEECKEQLKDLEEKQKQFEEEFIPLFNSLLEYFDNVTTSLNSGDEVVSFPELGVTKWQLLSRLKECKFVLEEFAEDSFNVKPMVNAFNRMQDALTMSIDLYSMIEHYRETQSLASYIALMQSATLGPIEITDPEYVDTVKEFDLKIKENLLDEEVKKAMHAFKQWVFPFADFYLTSVGTLKPLQPTSLSTTLAPGDVQLEQIRFLQEELTRYKSMIVGEHDTFIIQTNFSNSLKSSKAFYTWTNEEWEPEISLLLSGNPVSFHADVRKIGMEGWEAIKFKQIEIIPRMKGGTEEMRAEFQELLDYFGVTMTHTGVSHYRFLQEYFVMTGGNQTLVYNFEQDGEGNRLGTNMVYEKFKSGDFLLSPYTLWSIQFQNVVPTKAKNGGRLREDVTFEDLKKFAPYIDLELEGIGTYVNGEEALNAAGGDMRLYKHYDRDNSYKTDYKF